MRYFGRCLAIVKTLDTKRWASVRHNGYIDKLPPFAPACQPCLLRGGQQSLRATNLAVIRRVPLIRYACIANGRQSLLEHLQLDGQCDPVLAAVLKILDVKVDDTVTFTIVSCHREAITRLGWPARACANKCLHGGAQTLHVLGFIPCRWRAHVSRLFTQHSWCSLSHWFTLWPWCSQP